MEFCRVCENMLYTRTSQDETGTKTLENYCKNCGNVEILSSTDSRKIIGTQYSSEQTNNYSSALNPYLKYDPTLPRVNTIKCPNERCTKRKEDDNEVCYIMVDSTNMVFIYFCVYCNYNWRCA
jgi:DNA-directed RNA polymerase subunit M/transcription elongation factor TFIIS